VRFRRPKLKFLLDEGVPDSVGRFLKSAGHSVIYVNRGDVVPRSSKDPLVCASAILNDAILVATDGDMRSIAKGHGISNSAYAKLNLVKLSCLETEAAGRFKAAMTLIEHEWYVNAESAGRRLFVEIMTTVIRTNR
jgi:predicted nuclease of predicted toxin-antitoxin system